MLRDISCNLHNFVQIYQKYKNHTQAYKAKKLSLLNYLSLTALITSNSISSNAHLISLNNSYCSQALIELGMTYYTKPILELKISLFYENKDQYGRQIRYFIQDCRDIKAADIRDRLLRAAGTTNEEEIPLQLEKDQASE
jgi:hypothetical protein